jgi:peptide subunit release factor 1 (eRF1)
VRSVELQVPLREGVVLDEHACLSPLVAALDGTVCVGIVIVQRDGVRAIDVRLGEADEVERFGFDPAIDYDGRGRNIGSMKEEFDQFLSENRHRFLRSVAERLGPIADQRGWNPIILAGDARLTTQLDAALKKNGRELVHSDRTPGEYAAPGEVLRTFADDLDEFRIKRELKLVEQAKDAALGAGTGSLGLRDTLDALTQARVAHLVLEDGRNWPGQRSQDGAILVGSDAPLGLDTRDMIAEQNMAERMIERALATDAKVTVVQGPATEVLAEHEGVAAILRW